jgi:hypothetical protein
MVPTLVCRGPGVRGRASGRFVAPFISLRVRPGDLERLYRLHPISGGILHSVANSGCREVCRRLPAGV